jgi:hypothetical protein
VSEKPPERRGPRIEIVGDTAKLAEALSKGLPKDLSSKRIAPLRLGLDERALRMRRQSDELARSMREQRRREADAQTAMLGTHGELLRLNASIVSLRNDQNAAERTQARFNRWNLALTVATFGVSLAALALAVGLALV